MQSQNKNSSKNVVETKEHEELTELTKHHDIMNKLFYSSATVDWKKGTIADVEIATFSTGFLSITENTMTVKIHKLTNLFVTVFTTEDDQSDDDNDKPRSSLDRLMSLYVFTDKFARMHVNANYQSSELAIGEAFKSTSLNIFAYAPQNDRTAVLKEKKKLDQERNEIQWNITEKSKASSTIDVLDKSTQWNMSPRHALT
jgi:hypothetical protein